MGNVIESIENAEDIEIVDETETNDHNIRHSPQTEEFTNDEVQEFNRLLNNPRTPVTENELPPLGDFSYTHL